MLRQEYTGLTPPVYWVQTEEIPNKSKAFCCSSVGRVIFSKTYFPLSKVYLTIFKQIVPKSSSKVRKL